MIAVKIPADGTKPAVVVDDELTLEYLQAAVGGFIEAVNVSDVVNLYPVELSAIEFTVFGNEEGKLIGLPQNDRATGLCVFALAVGDVIAGDVIVIGPPGPEGEETPCPQGIIEILAKCGWL